MATLTISVPDEVLRQAQARLGGRGHTTIEQYLLSAVHALTLDGTPLDEETEAALMEGLDSLLEEMTDADWAAKLKRFDARNSPEAKAGDER